MSYDAVLKLFDEGCQVIPVHPKSKRPIPSNWRNVVMRREDLEAVFNHECDVNIGVVLGGTPPAVVEVDIDSKKAASIAGLFLPRTDRIFGRESKPASHYVYMCSDPGKTFQCEHPKTKSMIVELRSTGSQTVFPDSTHPSGEKVRYELGKDGPPSTVSFSELQQCVGFIATSELLSYVWREGSRHNLALSFSGHCAKSGIKKEICEKIIEAACRMSGDGELGDRLRCLFDTYNKVSMGEPVAGMSRFPDLVDHSVICKINGWLGIERKGSVVEQSSSRVLGQIIQTGTDLEFADLFVKSVSENLLFSEQMNSFYVRDNDVFRKIGSVTAIGFLREFLRFLVSNTIDERERKRIFRMQTDARMNGIFNISKTDLSSDHLLFDSDPMLLGCRNGVLSLSTHTLTKPGSIVTLRANCEFDPEAVCPRFERFIASIMGNDREMISYLQRSFGYSLTGLVTEQNMFLCIGPGANGKTTLQRAAEGLLGDYSASTPMQTLMTQKHSSANTYDLAALRSKRFVSAQEAEFDQKLAVAKIKSITGGDTIACRPIYGDPTQYVPNFKLWLFTNEMPTLPGGDAAAWRRLHIIPFNVIIPQQERDPRLNEVLQAERSGILNWALKGLAEFWSLGGLNPPAKVIQAIDNYREESNTVNQFVSSCCEATGDQSDCVLTGVLFDAYVKWCSKSAIEPISLVTFGKELGRLNFPSKKMRAANGRLGIRLLEIADTIAPTS